MSVFTPRLLEVFHQIVAMYDEGKGITRRSLAARVGVNSPNSVQGYLKRLKALGAVEYIEGEPGKKQGSLGGNTVVPLYSRIFFVESPCQDPLPTTGLNERKSSDECDAPTIASSCSRSGTTTAGSTP